MKTQCLAILLVGAFAAGATTFTVTNTLDSGAGSLRQAINDANANTGPDTIEFNISGTGPHTIAVGTTTFSSLPQITDSVFIDGYTQDGASPNTLADGNNAILKIVLDGSSSFGSGLYLTGGNSTVRGLVLGGFYNAISMETGGTNVIGGNFIGVDATGTNAFPNQFTAVLISESSGNVIGGTSPGNRNVISGNDQHGIEISSFGTGGGDNLIQGNHIGSDATGTRSIPNGQDGIRVTSRSNQIGGSVPGAGNVIVFNVGNGVAIGAYDTDTGVTNNAVLGNSIHGNGGLGIKLSADFPSGVTANDVCDADTGPNHFQNFPVLTLASNSGAGLQVSGTLNSTANTTFTLEFFASLASDASGNGEGEIFLGRTNVTTDGSCNASFTVGLTNQLVSGYWITATATDPNGNTSEFSPSLRLSGSFIMECFPHIGVALPTGQSNVVINYPTPDFQGDCRGLGLVCDPPSGSVFSLGSTEVNCTATNEAGESAVCSFRVSVINSSTPSVVSNTNEFGAGSLANAFSAATSGPEVNTVLFNIPGSGPHTITANLLLDTRSKSFPEAQHLYIDGYSQPGASPNTLSQGDNAVLAIQLHETATAPLFGIRFINPVKPGTLILRGLILSGFSHTAVDIVGNHCVVEGCFIGVNSNGTAVLGNLPGVAIDGSYNRIGGVLPAARNIISGNSSYNIRIGRSLYLDTNGIVGNVILGNYIGTQRDGLTSPGFSSSTGVRFLSGSGVDAAHDNRIGGLSAAEANVIAFNFGQGIVVGGSADATNNSILGNNIFSNGTLGLDLGNISGVTLNDAGDTDTGPNNLQNFPVLSSASSSGSSTLVGTLNSLPNRTYRLEFFANATCDLSGYGEGQTFLGAADVTTDGSGNVNFNLVLPTAIPSDQTNVTATATDPFGNTSEFSACIGAVVVPTGPKLTIVRAGPDQATVSWTPNTPGFMLQETLALAPTNWMPSPSGSTNPVTILVPGDTKFFRLFKP